MSIQLPQLNEINLYGSINLSFDVLREKLEQSDSRKICCVTKCVGIAGIQPKHPITVYNKNGDEDYIYPITDGTGMRFANFQRKVSQIDKENLEIIKRKYKFAYSLTTDPKTVALVSSKGKPLG